MGALVIIFVLISFLGFGQVVGSVSEDNLYLVTVEQIQGANNVVLYNLQEYVREKSFPIGAKSVSKVELSNDNKYVFILSGKTLFVYDVSSGKLAKKYYQVSDWAYSQERLVVVSNSLPVSYELRTGKEIFYRLLQGVPEKISISKDGRFFAIDNGQGAIYVYRYGDASIFKVLRGHLFGFVGNRFNVVYLQKANLQVFSFEVKDSLRRLLSFDAVKFLRSKGRSIYNLVPDKSSISPSFRYLALYFAGSKTTVLVVDLYRKQILQEVEGYKLYPVHWFGTKVIFEQGDLNGLSVDLVSGAKQVLYWEMLNPSKSFALMPKEQLKRRIFSPNFRYVVMEVYEGARKFLLVRDATVRLQQISYPDAEFVSFDRTSSRLFLMVKGILFVLRTELIKPAMEQGKPAELVQFGQGFKIEKEPFVAKDSIPPGYKFLFTKEIKPITSVDTSKLFVLFRGMGLDPKYVEVKLNLIDEEGNLITGATDPHWLYLWCNLLVMNKQWKVKQENFVVKEVKETAPTAYALVLDHSGSMGDLRANVLQAGALNLIKQKRPQDAFMLIKYDDKVVVEVPLSKDVRQFIKPLTNAGLRGYGGKTALNDAAYTAVSALAKTNYQKKVVFLFTDGYENSSVHTKEQVIELAAKNKIEIFTIGFGTKINEQYLKDLAYLTGGTFYHIYKTEDLRRIFIDVDLKRRYYYKITFTTDYPGKYLALLQMCQDFNHHDSLVINFNNNPQIPISKRKIQVNPPLPKQIVSKFEPYLIPCKPPTKPVQDPQILKEFESIDFPVILFEFDSDKIIKSEEKGILQIAEFMKKHPDVYLLIEGHTDSVGSYEYNIDLSKRRAEAAKRLLVKYGIAPGRIFTIGYGYTRPVASNATEEGRAKNRRIEFKIFRYR